MVKRLRPGADAPASSEAPAFEESADYEDFISNLVEQLDRWKASDEPTDQFARRVTGLMRMHDAKWREPARPQK